MRCSEPGHRAPVAIVASREPGRWVVRRLAHAMPTISLKEAVTKAEAFIATKRTQQPCGALQAINYEPANERDTARKNGIYSVEFACSGPPVHTSSHPRRDPPTIVIVNDETGECSIELNKPEKTPPR